MAGKKRIAPTNIERPAKRKEIEEEDKGEGSDSFSISNEKVEDSFDSDFNDEESERSKESDKSFEIEEYKKCCAKDRENKNKGDFESGSSEESELEEEKENKDKSDDLSKCADDSDTKKTEGKKKDEEKIT